MQLKIGASTFNDPDIRSLQINQNSALVMSELEPDTLTAVVEDRTTEVQLLAASSKLVAAGGRLLASQLSARGVNKYKYGEPITITLDSVITKMNVENIKRTATFLYQIDGISDIGLLMNNVYYGGIYNGITFSSLVSEIIDGIFSYTVDETLASMPLYGWLPKATRRDSLHSVLFAAGAVVRKSSSGSVQIIAQPEQSPYSLGDIYLGGTVEDIPPATKVTVVEHSYFALPTDVEETLFDGEVSAEDITTPKGVKTSGIIVEFSEPMHDLSITNSTIVEFDANYAVITQSPSAQLVGQKYTHTRRTLQQVLKSNGQPNEYTVDECGLVNLMNSENVLARLIAYYSATKQYPIDFVFNNQKPGDMVSFTDPFGDSATGFIETLDITASHTSKAAAVITEGYVPTASGNYFTNVLTYTTDGTFTVPSECKGKIKAILISGGQGGYAGENGEDGGYANGGSTEGGRGGEGGQGGQGGRIYVITFSVAVGQQISYHIGTGGDGAAPGGTPQDGGDTTFGNYTSANGFTAENGYPLLLLDEIVGLHGDIGVNGGNGGDAQLNGEDVIYNGVTYTGGVSPEGTYQPEFGGTAPSGGGGGAAVGNDGSDGGTGIIRIENVGGTYQDYVYGGDGGDGANAIAREAATGIGQGGGGGHGGGGGGSGADGTGALGDGDAGAGGLGGSGGRGSNGALVVYY